MSQIARSIDIVDATAFLIRNAYLGILGREPDALGASTYRGYINSGEMSGADLIRHLLSSPEYVARQNTSRPAQQTAFGCSRLEAEAIFKEFAVFKGNGKAGFVTNFLGGITDVEVSSLLPSISGHVEDLPIPGNFHGETLEWVATLRSALEARDRFSLVELGAGWGPWCVIGYQAARHVGVKEIKLVGVEADAGHVEFMKRHFTDNEVPTDCAKVVLGAVGIKDGVAHFPKARHADNVYGGTAAYSSSDQDTGPFADFMRNHSSLVNSIDEVPCFSLSGLLEEFDILNILHCDIQGGEMEIFPASIELLNAKVRRVVIGTHSFDIERRLAELFGGEKWTCEGLSSCAMENKDGQETLVRDGMQVWSNPTLSAAPKFC